MHITVFEVEEWERGAFERLEREHRVRFTAEPLNAQTASRYSDTECVSTFIYSKLDAGVLEMLPQLRLIATRSTGVDHIDLDFCRQHHIAVSNVPTYGKNTVAEHAFALLLALSRRLVDAVDRTRRGDFSFKGLRGFDLRDKTLGVIGTGDIGQCVIEIANGFHMRVLAFDVKPRQELREELAFDYVDLDNLLHSSDIITLHVPAIPQTRHMIAGDEFKKMKDGAVLINTSRGAVVDIQALAEALATGKIAGAGLDVLPQEPVIREEAELLRSVYQKEHEPDLASLLADNVLMRVRNVIVTPHNAFNTEEAVHRILDTTVENIAAFAKGEPVNTAGKGE
jgi:D-lactate dehydrogenase